jgi:hypothetical protein
MNKEQQLLVEAARRGLLPKMPVRKAPGSTSTGNIMDLLEQGATFGFADEVGAAGAATGAFLKELPKTWDVGQAGTAAGETYNRRLGEIRQGIESYRAEHPVLGTGAEILGGLGTAGTLAKQGATLLNVARPTIPNMMLRGAGEGAAYGGAYGFGTGEGGAENRLRSAAAGAAIGGVTGGVLGGVGSLAANRAAASALRRGAPTKEALKKSAHEAYDAADAAGLVVSQSSFSRAVSDIADAAVDAGIDKTIHPRATAALARLEEALGKQPTLSELEILRRVLKGAAASPEADERRIADLMIDGLDDYVGNLSHMDVVAGDPLKASSEITRARDLWSRLRKTEMIEDAVTKAERRAASTGSGGNLDNAIRQNIRAILDNPKKARGFTKEERELMESVVKGGPVQNMLRLLGKLSPGGNGLMTMLHGTAGIATGGATLPLMMAGAVSKGLADRMTPQRIQSLLTATRSGGAPTPGAHLTAAQRVLLESAVMSAAQQGQNVLP